MNIIDDLFHDVGGSLNRELSGNINYSQTKPSTSLNIPHDKLFPCSKGESSYNFFKEGLPFEASLKETKGNKKVDQCNSCITIAKVNSKKNSEEELYNDKIEFWKTLVSLNTDSNCVVEPVKGETLEELSQRFDKFLSQNDSLLSRPNLNLNDLKVRKFPEEMKKFSNVKYLSVCNSSIETLEGLDTRSLRKLCLNGVQKLKMCQFYAPVLQDLMIEFANIGPLGGINCPELKGLFLQGSRVGSLSGIVAPHLHFLNLHLADISSLSGVSLPKLTILVLADSPITSLEKFSAPNLLQLHAKSSDLLTLNGASFPRLEKLDIRDTRVRNIGTIDAIKVDILYRPKGFSSN
jgi:Leucine-rich repeat (LRR) protein